MDKVAIRKVAIVTNEAGHKEVARIVAELKAALAANESLKDELFTRQDIDAAWDAGKKYANAAEYERGLEDAELAAANTSKKDSHPVYLMAVKDCVNEIRALKYREK